ncbi:MAG: helix-turn-helix domain-containing protein [Gemmatimonadales bacterium]|jgi:AraC-like DNA-binding protein
MIAPAPLVATVLEPRERAPLDVAARGRFRPVHAESVTQAIRAVRERPVNTVLLSAHRVDAGQLAGVSMLVRGFPGVATVAVVSQYSADATERLLDLGACGVRRVLDLNARDGWRELRTLLDDPTTPIAAQIRGRVMPVLDDATPPCRAYFDALIRLAPVTGTVRAMAERIGVSCSTLMSRFFRAQLPSPKRYLAVVRLLYAAGLFKAPALSIADVAYRLEYSSPQSFGRHLRSVLGITAAAFRQRYTLETALEHFVARLVVPYRSIFRTFRPLDYGVPDPGLLRETFRPTVRRATTRYS